MNFDYQHLGNKLKFARESLLMSYEDVSSKIGITTKEYQEIESGRKQVSGDTVVLLSQILHRDFRYFVTNDTISVESQIQALYRQNSNITQRDRIGIQDFIRHCETKTEFEEILGTNRSKTPDYHNKFDTNYYKHNGEEMANLERKRLGISDSVDNLYSLIRRQNIHVFRRELEDNSISGLYIHHPLAGHCILINYNEDIYRQNFSLAHEYAHVLADSNYGQSVSYHKYKNNDLREVRANNFASFFLLPSDAVQHLNVSVPVDMLVKNIAMISRKYGVTSQVILIRLKELGVITETFKKEVEGLRKIKVPVENRIDPELNGVSKNFKERALAFIKNGLSVEYIDLCRRVYQEGLVSFGKVMESLQLSYEEGQELMSIWSTNMEI